MKGVMKEWIMRKILRHVTFEHKLGVRTKIFGKKWHQKGQGLIEYVIVSTFVGVCCLLALKQLGQVLEKRILHLKKEVVEHIPPN
jgi:hypothetical protein